MKCALTFHDCLEMSERRPPLRLIHVGIKTGGEKEKSSISRRQTQISLASSSKLSVIVSSKFLTMLA